MGTIIAFLVTFYLITSLIDKFWHDRTAFIYEWAGTIGIACALTISWLFYTKFGVHG